jgi:hypothetical protein
VLEGERPYVASELLSLFGAGLDVICLIDVETPIPFFDVCPEKPLDHLGRDDS